MTPQQEPSSQTPEGCLVLSMGDFIPWDNPENLVSQEVERAVDVGVGLVALPVLFVLGCGTNALNAAVFWRQGLKQRIHCCLFCLSLADWVYMLHSFLLNVDRLYLPVNSTQLGAAFEFLVKKKLVGFRGLSWVSGFLSTLIACERCFCVVSPLKSRTLLSTKTTAILISVCSLVILAGFFVVATGWDVACVYDPESNATSRTIYGSEFYIRNKQVMDTFDGIVYGLVLPVLYVSVVIVTTVITLYKLRQFSAWRQHTTTSSSAEAVTSRELALTRMLIGVSVMYVICMVPTLALGSCILLVEEFNLRGRYYNAFNLMLSVFELFTYINASFNFFVYWFLGSRYKETLKGLFACGGNARSLNVANTAKSE